MSANMLGWIIYAVLAVLVFFVVAKINILNYHLIWLTFTLDITYSVCANMLGCDMKYWIFMPCKPH